MGSATRIFGYLSVLGVVGVSGHLSHWHIVSVVTRHGEPGADGHVFPAIIDGTILAASAVLMDRTRHQEKAPVLAWLMAILGVVATLAANIAYGPADG